MVKFYLYMCTYTHSISCHVYIYCTSKKYRQRQKTCTNLLFGCGYFSYQPINNPKTLLEKFSINSPPPQQKERGYFHLCLLTHVPPFPHPSTSQFLTLTKLLEGTKVTARANDAVIEANPEGENTLTCKAPTGRHSNTPRNHQSWQKTVLVGQITQTFCM